MSDVKKSIPLWVMHLLGVLFVILCTLGAEYMNASKWLWWIILVASLYVAFKVIGLVLVRRLRK